VGALAAAVEGRPHVWYLHECFLNPATGLFFPPGQPVLARAVGELSTALMVVSEAVKREYAPYVGEASMRVVPSGIEVDTYGRSPDLRAVKRFLSVGTTSHGKGLDDLVEAVRIVHANGRDVTVDVLGSFDSADYEVKILKQVRALGLVDALRFRGWREDSPQWYAQADVVCCPSHAESFGRSVVEGMAAGRPVIATRCGGPEETVVEGQTGLLVEPHDPRALAGAMERLVASPDLARTMGRNGRKRACQLYDLVKCADAWVAVIDLAMEDRGRSRSPTGMIQLILALLVEAGPRMLLGRKRRVLSAILDSIGRPVMGA
jgi:glycosyltransferase involved in cell wall biosynthesis